MFLETGILKIKQNFKGFDIFQNGIFAEIGIKIQKFAQFEEF